MKILCTGDTGLVGSNLIPKLKADGHEVMGMSRRSGFDLRDELYTAIYIKDFKPDVVFHLAANAAESRGQVSPIDMTERNLGIFLNVLVPSINSGVKQFIYMSSVAVYGDVDVPYSEDSICKPKDVYGVNKLGAEQILKILAKVHNFDYTIFRPHNIYGPHQDMRSPYKNVVALFMRNIMEEKELTIFGKGKMKRAFSYVDDVCEVLRVSTEERFHNQTINLGSVREIEIRTLLSMIEDIAGKKAKVKQLPARPQEIYNFLASHRLQGMLTEYNETPLEQGLKTTWEFLNLPDIITENNEII